MKSLHALLLIVLIAFFGTPLKAATWIVDVSGQGDFTLINDAVDSASASDTILVRPGTYEEWVKFRPGKDGILLRGDGPVEAVIILCDTVVVSVSGIDPAVRIENLTLTGSRLYGALLIFQAKAEIVGCVIRDNVGPGDCLRVGGGGQIHQSEVLIEDCLIENNHSWESRADIRNNVFRNNSSCYGGGLQFYHCEGYGLSVVDRNLFLNNDADNWGGGLFNVDSSPEIRNNTFVGNGGAGRAAIWVLGGSPDIHHNIIVDSDEAIHCQSLGGYPLSTPVIGDNICWSITSSPLTNCASTLGLRVENPLFCDAASDNFGLCADSPAVEGGVAIYGAFDIECAECGETPVRSTSWGSLKKIFSGSNTPATEDSTSTFSSPPIEDQ